MNENEPADADTGVAPPASTEAETRAPVLVDPDRLKPLPKDLFGMPCAKCGKDDSRWAFMPDDLPRDAEPLPQCSKCFLYESGWGANRAKPIADMVGAVEKSIGEVFAKNELGQLTERRDCDRIMAAVAYISRKYVMLQNSMAEAPPRIITDLGRTQSRIPIVGKQFKIFKA